MADKSSEEKWQVRFIRPGLPGLDRLSDLGLPDLSRLPWLNQPLLPAEIGNGLRDAMLAKDNHLEDVNYQKIVPNRYVVEVNPENYARHYRPIEAQILKQWSDRLLEELITANSRQGRKEFRFGGRLQLQVQPSDALRQNEARILSRIEPDGGQQGARLRQEPVARPPAAPQQRVDKRPSRPSPENISNIRVHPVRQEGTVQAGRAGAAEARKPAAGAQPTGGKPPAPDPLRNPPPSGSRPTAAPAGSVAYLELLPTGQTWALYPGVNTIGRSESCQIYLDMPVVQDRRLVSGQHAYILFQNGQCFLYDGSPDGRPSANGTYVNLRRVPPSGYHLQNGDAIVLAAVDPLFPRSDTPGVATFYFWTNRRE